MTVATSTASPANTTQASAPPDGLPAYRLLTGPDDASFLAVYRRNGQPVAVLGVDQPRLFTRWRRQLPTTAISV